MGTAAFVAGIAAAASAAPAGTTEKAAAPATATAAATTADAATCADPAVETAKREAALAEVGRKLAAEPVVAGEFRVLNRAGHNYGAGRAPVAPPQPPAEPAAKR
ncbi:MAG: hypothetical protein DCC71_15755 [Proteobacteria bacterium]|nr:MAG: hypothetical protein DCC71_15755 [Pseudomonadota bacterium]